jgi:hypothetical protein
VAGIQIPIVAVEAVVDIQLRVVAAEADIQLRVVAVAAAGTQLPAAAEVAVVSTPPAVTIPPATIVPIADDKNFEVLPRAAPQAALFFCLSPNRRLRETR